MNQRLTTPIFIVSKDRPSMLQQMLARLEQAGCRNLYIVDTGSTYPPLLAYYQSLSYPIWMERDPGTSPQLVPWGREVIRHYGCYSKPYVVADCDAIPDPDCPDDFLERLHHLLAKYPGVSKAGLGLRINDLPDHYARKAEVCGHEAQFWTRKLEPDVYEASVDTTFALYRPNIGWDYLGLRTGPPYLLRHLPWYVDSAHPTEEHRYYRQHCVPRICHWS